MFRLFECCALSFFERFVLSFSLKIERFVSDSAEILICGLYMSLKKTPAEKVKTKHQIPPEKWEVIYGEYKSNLRLCFLPLDENTKCGYWFGFETEIQRTFPVFKAKTDI